MQPAIVAMAALCADGPARLLLAWTTAATATAAKCHQWNSKCKKKKKKEKHVFSFFPSATHKEEKKTKRLRSISPIRNRLQIKL